MKALSKQEFLTQLAATLPDDAMIAGMSSMGCEAFELDSDTLNSVFVTVDNYYDGDFDETEDVLPDHTTLLLVTS